MAAFLHHCPFLKSAAKPALRRTGASFLSLADQCPIIARQISVSGAASLEAKMNVSPQLNVQRLPTMDQTRLFAQAVTQVAVSVSKACPFVSSQIGMVQASPEVQEDVQGGISQMDSSAMSVVSYYWDFNLFPLKSPSQYLLTLPSSMI